MVSRQLFENRGDWAERRPRVRIGIWLDVGNVYPVWSPPPRLEQGPRQWCAAPGEVVRQIRQSTVVRVGWKKVCHFSQTLWLAYITAGKFLLSSSGWTGSSNSNIKATADAQRPRHPHEKEAACRPFAFRHKEPERRPLHVKE